MQVISVISTNGDVGKTAVAANPGSFVADAGLRVLLLDLDMQPTLSSYYERISHAPSGIDERLAFNMQDLRTVLLELELLTWQQAISPVTPETLAAQELSLGPVQLVADIAPYRNLGMTPPPLHLLINRVLAVSSNAHIIQKTLNLMLQEQADIHILDTEIPVMKPFLMQQLSACKRIASIRNRRTLHEKLCATWQQSCCSSGMSSSCKSQEKPAEGMPMSTARELTRGHKLLLPLIEYALKEGWEVERTSGGHLKFTKPGMPPIFTGSTASDYCAGRNTRALLRRTRHQFATDESSPKK